MNSSIGILISIFFVTSCVSGLRGVVVDQNGDPITHKEGRINVFQNTSSTNSLIKVVELQSEGRFHVEDLDEKKRIFVEALVPGYEIASITVEPKQDKNIRVVLSRIGKPDVDGIGYSKKMLIGTGSGGADLTPPKM